MSDSNGDATPEPAGNGDPNGDPAREPVGNDDTSGAATPGPAGDGGTKDDATPEPAGNGDTSGAATPGPAGDGGTKDDATAGPAATGNGEPPPGKGGGPPPAGDVGPGDPTPATGIALDDASDGDEQPGASRTAAVSNYNRSHWWTASVLTTLILVVLLLILWVDFPSGNPSGSADLVITTSGPRDLVVSELTNIDAWNCKIDQNENPPTNAAEPIETRMRPEGDTGVPPQVRTGVWIQSMRFVSPNDVRITGYVWQRFDGNHTAEVETQGWPDNEVYPAIDLSATPARTVDPDPCATELEKAIDPDATNQDLPSCKEPGDATQVGAGTSAARGSRVFAGVVFPDQVDSSFELRPTYLVFDPCGVQQVANEDGTARLGTTTLGWYFEGPIRQNISVRAFPFDDKTIRLRIWPWDFESSAVLAPDYQAYPCAPAQPTLICTKEGDTFGFDEDIVIEGYRRPTNTFFDLNYVQYNSSFGFTDASEFQDMSFNVAIQRDRLNLFVGNLVPLVVGAGLAFTVLMTVTADRERTRRFSFSTTQVMTTLAALFVAVLLAHLQLRSRFVGVVYLETFYFLLYLALLLVAINAILVTAPQTRDLKFFRLGDNFPSQLLFWPTLTGAAVLATLVVRWGIEAPDWLP